MPKDETFVTEKVTNHQVYRKLLDVERKLDVHCSRGVERHRWTGKQIKLIWATICVIATAGIGAVTWLTDKIFSIGR